MGRGAWRAGVHGVPKSQTHPQELLSCCSVAQSCPTLWPRELQHTRLPCPSPSPRVCSNSCPLSQWCHPAISSSIISFSSCLQSFPASGSFPMSWLFTSDGQSVGVSASSVLPMNIQGWFPLGLTGLILTVQRTLKSLSQHHSSKASSCLKQHKLILLWSWKSEVQNGTFLSKIRESAGLVPSWGSWRGLFLDSSNF